MTMSAVDEYRRYKVPDEASSALIDPDLNSIGQALSSPILVEGGDDLEFCGKPLSTVRRQAREEVVELAYLYTGRYAAPRQRSSEEISAKPVILAGHQPELFHAGVWFKNFLLGRFAAGGEAIAINFLVDNDLCRSTSVRVPSRNESGAVIATSVPFDAQRNSVPWEMRSVVSWETWNSFPERVHARLLELRGAPLLHDIWQAATARLKENGKIGSALAEARHRLELSEGLDTMEVPLSSLVSTRAFARFSIQLLAELPRFQSIYNSQRDRYRRLHRIRSQAHPVPALEQSHGWLEAPWWVYRAEAPQRRKLWVRLLDEQLFLSDRAGWQAVIEGRLDCDQASSQWLDLLAEGVCLRPRALLTTMYLRLFVGDLFVHGIGGGMYDQLTNEILREFFCIEPPPMAVASATMRLPYRARLHTRSVDVVQADLRSQREHIWELQHHADAFQTAGDGEALDLIRQKQRLLEHIPQRGEKWKWHQQMVHINEQLRARTAEQSRDARESVSRLAAELRQSKVLNSREYSFCLFPQDYLVPQLKSLAGFPKP